jgi:hypothetical protein
MTVGNKVIVDAVFRDTGLDGFLDGLKRNQGESVSNEIKALVANSTFILESTCHRYGAARCTFLPFCASLDDYPHELT